MITVNKAASIYDAIERIAATPSKIEKEAMVKAVGSLPLFMKVARAAYDPFVTYGIKPPSTKTPGIAPGGNTLDEEMPWKVLGQLAERTLTGNKARDVVQRVIDLLDDPSSELFRRILRKDLRAGFTGGTINRVFPKTLAEYPYMRCSLPDKSDMAKWDWSVGIISQEKADGMFCNVNKDFAGSIWLTTRQGSPIPLDNLLPLELAIQIIIKPDTQTHGELTVYRDRLVLPREVGNGMLNSVIQGGTLDEGCTVRFDAWDQIPLSAVVPKGKYDVRYRTRLTELIKQVAAATASEPNLAASLKVIPTRIVKSKAEAYEHYRELLKRGREGTIDKHPDTPWKDGTSKGQVKLKLEADVDLEVVNIIPGTIGTKNEGRPGSLECRTSCGGLSVNVTIKNEEMREAVEADPDAWPGNIMTVRSNSVMAPTAVGGLHSLFLGRFIEIVPREKEVADTLEQVFDQFRNAVEAV